MPLKHKTIHEEINEQNNQDTINKPDNLITFQLKNDKVYSDLMLFNNSSFQITVKHKLIVMLMRTSIGKRRRYYSKRFIKVPYTKKQYYGIWQKSFT